MEATKFKWQWVGIMTQLPDNLADLTKNTHFPNNKIILKQSSVWFKDYHTCQENAYEHNDIDIPDSWGLELCIVSEPC